LGLESTDDKYPSVEIKSSTPGIHTTLSLGIEISWAMGLMEFQTIEYTKCCHRLFGLLAQSTILDLVGEPWFKADENEVRMYSRTASKELVSLVIMTREEKISFTSKLEAPEFAPLREEIRNFFKGAGATQLPDVQLDLELCRILDGFLRAHYKKFH